MSLDFGRSSRPRTQRQNGTYAARAREAELRRARAMSQILSLRGDGLRSSRFADKAHSLLTSRWSKASWRMRASILDTVDWLLLLEMADRNETALVDRRMASHKGG